MIKFKKPRYKNYKTLLEDVRNDYSLEKFNSKKWLFLKKLFRFQLNKWKTVYYKKPFKKIIPYFFLRKKEKFTFLKKLHFIYYQFNSFSGVKNKARDLSLYNFWGHKFLPKEFKNNLIKKQRLCCYYSIQNYKLKKLVHKSQNYSLVFSSYLLNFNFINLLEIRLENILYKSGFVRSICQSRQLINYGNVLVNKVCQTKGSYCVNQGDLIEFSNDFSKAFLLVQLKDQRKLLKKKRRKKKRFLKLRTQTNSLKGSIALGFFRSKKFRKSKKYLIIKKYLINFYIDNPLKKIYMFFFNRFFPSYFEVNYKTFSILYLGSINIQKSFKYYLDLSSLLSFYKNN